MSDAISVLTDRKSLLSEDSLLGSSHQHCRRVPKDGRLELRRLAEDKRAMASDRGVTEVLGRTLAPSALGCAHQSQVSEFSKVFVKSA